LAKVTVPPTPEYSYEEFIKGLRPIRKKVQGARIKEQGLRNKDEGLSSED